MPVKIGKRIYHDHDDAVEAVKKWKKPPKDPDAYVASIERKQREKPATKKK